MSILIGAMHFHSGIAATSKYSNRSVAIAKKADCQGSPSCHSPN